MIDREKIVCIAEKALTETQMFLVDVTVSRENDIEVEVDSMDRVSIEDCSNLSRLIEAGLDRDKEDFSLTVISSGIGYPFKVFRQYQKAIGKTVEVKNADGVRISGILEDCKNEGSYVAISLSYEKKEKNEGDKRPHMVRHEDEIKVVDGISVKEIITIK